MSITGAPCICADTGLLLGPGPSGETFECWACAPVVIDEREAADNIEQLAAAVMRLPGELRKEAA